MVPSSHRVSQGSNAVDSALYHIAGLQEFRRVEAHADAGGSAGGDDGAGQQRHAGGQLLDDVRDGGNQQVCGGILPQLAVDAGGDMQSRRKGDLVSSDDAGANGGKAVQTFAEIPLLVGGLQDTGRHIVEDGIAEDIVRRVFCLHVFRRLADDDRQLGFVVQPLHKAGVALD